jgi:hypothetical protein
MGQAVDMVGRVDVPRNDTTTAMARRLGHPKYLKMGEHCVQDN